MTREGQATKKPKSSIIIQLKSGESIELFISPRPRTIGFDSLDNIKSFYITVDYLKKGSK